MKELGFVPVNKHEAEKLAKEYLYNWQQRDDALKKAAIDYEMNKHWFPAKTEIDALQRHLEVFGGYRWTCGTGWKARAEEILMAIKLCSGDDIWLSIEIAAWLQENSED